MESPSQGARHRARQVKLVKVPKLGGSRNGLCPMLVTLSIRLSRFGRCCKHSNVLCCHFPLDAMTRSSCCNAVSFCKHPRCCSATRQQVGAIRTRCCKLGTSPGSKTKSCRLLCLLPGPASQSEKEASTWYVAAPRRASQVNICQEHLSLIR